MITLFSSNLAPKYQKTRTTLEASPSPSIGVMTLLPSADHVEYELLVKLPSLPKCRSIVSEQFDVFLNCVYSETLGQSLVLHCEGERFVKKSFKAKK